MKEPPRTYERTDSVLNGVRNCDNEDRSARKQLCQASPDDQDELC